MATPNKAQFLADVQALLKKRYKPQANPPKLSVLEATVYGICHEDATRAQAEKALEAFKSGFFDWNELRVSPIAEIQGILETIGISDAEAHANRLRRFLRQLFEKTYSFNLDALAKKPLKEASKSLGEYEAFHSDFVLASVTRLALGGHAIGIDGPILRALDRLGVVEPGSDDATLRASLERAVPKNRGAEFVDLMEDLAHDTCVEGEPDCVRCELKKVCPSSRVLHPELAVVAPAPVAAPTKAAKPAKAAPIAAPTATLPPPGPAAPTPPGKPKPGRPKG